jgi:tripeptidyl-peptidase-2
MNMWEGLLPKVTTQAQSFVEKNPDWDGRGVIIGVLDTGVDPGAAGLGVTSDGRPKVIDVIDCTGSGDVKMTESKPSTEEGVIVGVGGKKLTLNKGWKNPSGKWNVGMKRVFELYPSSLKKRVESERKKEWNKLHKAAQLKLQKALAGKSDKPEADSDEALALAELERMEKNTTDPGPVLDCVTWFDGEHWQAAVDTSATGDMSNLESMANYSLSRQFRRFSDVDNFNFCVNIFDEGSILSIVVDSGAHGTHVAGICAAFYPDGSGGNGVAPGAQIVSLKIGDSRLGSMETGVGLVRALTEAVNRGCHVINMSFGEAAAWDDTGRIVELAAEIVREHNICFIGSAGNNGPAISTVGAPCGTSSAIISVGAFADQSLMQPGYSMLQEVPETNYTWSSVGPALDGAAGVSVMAPGGAVTCVPTYTLNRGQLMNGTSMSAPNCTGCVALLLSAARAQLPEQERNNRQCMPHPALMRRVLEGSAKLYPDVHVLGQGHGLVQVEAAWELLSDLVHSDFSDVSYSIYVNSERFSRGIYLRQLEESRAKNTFSVTATPVFPRHTPADRKHQFEQRLVLCASQPWIQCPAAVDMFTAGKTFSIVVDPCQLAVGEVHVGFVRAFLDGVMESPAVFEIPVTVVRPVALHSNSYIIGGCSKEGREGGPSVLSLTSAKRHRTFLVPPPGATVCGVLITDRRTSRSVPVADSSVADDQSPSASDDSSSRLVVFHALQTLRGVPYRDNEKDTYLRLTPGSTHALCFSVHPEVTMEVVLARFWNTLGDQVNLTCELTFHGGMPSPQALHLSAGQRVSKEIRVGAGLGVEEVAPAAKLTDWRHVVMPVEEGRVSPLGERDVLPDGSPIYQLVLTYAFDNDAKTSVTPRFPGLQGVLYESCFHGQFFILYDNSKKLLGAGDAWPSKVFIGAGKHTVCLQVRHESVKVLEALKDTAMLLERPLVKPVTLKVFKSQTSAASEGNGGSGSSTAHTANVTKGGSVGFFFREPTHDSLPKGAKPGDHLAGSFTVLKKSPSALMRDVNPRDFPCIYCIGDTKPPTTTASAKSEDKEKDKEKEKEKESKPKPEDGDGAAPNAATPATESESDPAAASAHAEKVAEIVRDAMVQHLNSSSGSDDFEAVRVEAFKALSEGDRTHLSVLLALLGHARKVAKKIDTTEVHQAVLRTADDVVASVDQSALAQALGVNVNKEDKAAVAERKKKDSDKSALAEAFAGKAMALLALLRLASVTQTESAQDSAAAETNEAGGLSTSLEDSLAQLRKWDNITADKHWKLWVTYNMWRCKWGTALKKLNDLLTASADNKNKDNMKREELYKERNACLSALGWNHLLDYSTVCARYSNLEHYYPF